MAKRKSGRNIHGILLLDKRLGVSSNQALQEIKRLLNANKAGHTGALDPLATGLLPLCFGEATKVSGMMLDDNKRYQATVRLGVMTDTGDSEGAVIAEMPVPAFTKADLRRCLDSFVGEIEQVPPMYSALKHNGKKLYELAREGKTVERPARRIHIYEIKLLGFSHDQLQLDVSCSKGTYIRSLAEDIAHKLGSCGTLSALRRTAAGDFTLTNACTLEQFQALSDQERLACLLPVDAPLQSLPKVNVSLTDAGHIKQGREINSTSTDIGTVRIYCQHAFLGLGELLLNGKLAPRKLFLLDEQSD